MKKLTAERAAELKSKGITHIASVVKSHYYTEYFKYEPIETILAYGGKMPQYSMYNGFVHGINGNKIDWSTTIRWSEI